MVSSSLPKKINGTGGSNLTSQAHPGGTTSHPPSRSSNSRKPHSSVGSTASSASWNSASYFEALNILSDDTMSQACALVLHATNLGDNRCHEQLPLTVSSENKNDASTENTNSFAHIDQQDEQESVSALPNPTADEMTLKSTVDPEQNELEKLQLLFRRCRQAASTFERESTLKLQQQKLLISQPGLVPIGTSSAIPGVGTIARSKASSGVILNNSAGHRTSLIRNGSGRAPLGGGASTLPIVATSTKGSMGAAISTISGIGGIHRRRPLEREKSDSSSATTASSSKGAAALSSSSFLKAAARNTKEDAVSHQKKVGKSGSEVVPPPPPSALQFLAMLNNDTPNSPKAKKTEAASDPVDPKRNGDTKSLGSISPPSAKRVKVSPPKIIASSSTPESSPVRIQPPRASRK